MRLISLTCLASLVLFFFLLSEKTSFDEVVQRCRTLEKHLENARALLVKNKDLALPAEMLPGANILANKSLRTILMEAAERTGIPGRLEGINPTVDKKKGLLKARVALRGVRLEEIVKFLLYLKNLSAGIMDREASMRMIGYNQDKWKLDLLLEAPMIRGEVNGKK